MLQSAPYAVIGDNVRIGDGTFIDSFAHVLEYTEVGKKLPYFPLRDGRQYITGFKVRRQPQSSW